MSTKMKSFIKLAIENQMSEKQMKQENTKQYEPQKDLLIKKTQANAPGQSNSNELKTMNKNQIKQINQNNTSPKTTQANEQGQSKINKQEMQSNQQTQNKQNNTSPKTTQANAPGNSIKREKLMTQGELAREKMLSGQKLTKQEYNFIKMQEAKERIIKRSEINESLRISRRKYLVKTFKEKGK